MKRTAITSGEYLNGYDLLTDVRTQPKNPDDELLTEALSFDTERHYQNYFKNPAYEKYMRMRKILVGEKGAHELLEIASKLEVETMPAYVEASGSAYVEAGMALVGESTVERQELVAAGKACWERALAGSETLLQSDTPIREDSAPFRLARSLAFIPVIQSFLAGNVTTATRERAFADTLAIAQASAIQRHLADRDGSGEGRNDHSGFIHECNALLTLLYIDDPKYIPLPAVARADNGVYHPKQTHDIMLLNQRYGDIIKVIPVEIKSASTAADRRRYKSLIVRGKMHLLMSGNDPTTTLDSFARAYDDIATTQDRATIGRAATNMAWLLKTYQKKLPSGNTGFISDDDLILEPSLYARHLYR